MVFSFYEICWFFFIYSFLGWCGEVCLAAFYRKKFINRGVVNSPFCPIYGTGAVAFTIFLPELKGNLFFLFLGGMILASFIEFVTGALLEKAFHRNGGIIPTFALILRDLSVCGILLCGAYLQCC